MSQVPVETWYNEQLEIVGGDGNTIEQKRLVMPTATFCNLQFVIATSLPNTAADVAQLRKDFEELKLDIEDILHGQNDINESTRVQLQAIYEPKLG